MPGLKPVDKASNPGLAKLPKEARNKMGYMNKGGVPPTKFKVCSSCPSPAKCKAAGKCLKKGAKKAAEGMLVIPVSMSKVKPKKGRKG